MATGSILLVEDNEDDVYLTLRSFERHHFTNEINVASDGEEALDYLFGRNGKKMVHPMLILLDLNLPKMSGMEVLQAIKQTKQTSLIPVIILTSSREEQDMIKGYDLGANNFLCKPVDFVKFVDVVTKLGNYWLALNEPV
ncbi:Response regulator receiver [Fulvivirga imtechensis AK7]|uniref:Response regulator receiver n=1 Tax=Fulvivirga imtechensis AK7 TaxID=1237149 RepID=L8JZI3_9BACT|nr:response regulator [Fulvivirga imtechensis]ELR73074.1 Response regulator receiver [Fulvivirga imtechensis AK7]